MNEVPFELNSNTPDGPLATKWQRHLTKLSLVSPNNKRKLRVAVVGTGLAGASAAASLAELSYQVEAFTFHDSPRRAHSIAAQGGINAAKNYQNDGDSVWRLFYDTIKGGDFRSREANVYRLAEVSSQIIDQCVAQGVPLAREYGGQLANRSFGGAQVSRTFYCRGQTGQQLLLGAYSALSRQIAQGQVRIHPRVEMLDLVIADGRAVGIITRNLVTGAIETCGADAVVLANGGYSNVYYLSTNAKASNVTATFRAYKRGAAFANPCFTQIHPTCIPASGGANRLGASALMQGLADGYFILPCTMGDYLAKVRGQSVSTNAVEFKEADTETRARLNRLYSGSGKRTATSIHRELGKLMIEACGMSRSGDGLQAALARIPELREEFYRDVTVPGGSEMNSALEYAGRVADFLEFAEVMCHDALARDESCGAHFRVEHQTKDGEAVRDDERFCSVSAWEFCGTGKPPALHIEPLSMEHVELAVRNYQ